MRRYGFDNGEGTTFELGLRFLEFPAFEYGHEIINHIEIPGRAGTLTENTGTYTDTVITNTVEFYCSNTTEYEYKLSEIRKWLMDTKKLTYSDMEDRYFIVKKVEIEEESRLYNVFGNITVKFTCHPAVFLNDGDSTVTAASGVQLYNPYSVTCPVYYVSGEGVCTLAVNGKPITANVGQNLTIDTEMMVAYRSDGTMQNTSITGRYKDLYLLEGNNTLTFTSGFSVSVKPRWRILK